MEMSTFEKILFDIIVYANIGSGIIQLATGNFATAMMNFGIAHLVSTIR